ncbi:response regulator [Larkinella sp. VNQ87]|uniref:response regulator n=1 Tax=Larkinella sp. VNQ87 TaxID=3400921 RepID=UPI003BFB9E28
MIGTHLESAGKSRMIYLVDDDEDDIELFRMAAESCFPNDVIRVFKSGPALLGVLAEAKTKKPAVIFINGMMPVMDGVQTLVALRQMPEIESIPKILLSGGLPEKRIEEARQAGAVICLEKPHSVRELMASLAKIQSIWIKPA